MVLTKDLGDVTAAAYTHANINLLELVVADKEDGLEDLVPHRLREETIDGVAVDVNHTPLVLRLCSLAVRDCDGIFLKRREHTNKKALLMRLKQTPCTQSLCTLQNIMSSRS